MDVLGHSNTTRQGIISAAVEDLKKPVRLLMQRPRHILKPRQRSQIGASVHDALTALEETGLFELRFHKNHASLRLTLLRGEDRQAVAAVVGWYLYREEDRVVPGARNPSVYALEADNPLVAWAAEEFQTKWSSAEEVTLANHHRLLQREEDAAR